MKLIKFNVAGQDQVFVKYDSEEELRINGEIEKLFGKPVVDPFIEIKDVKGRRFFIKENYGN